MNIFDTTLGKDVRKVIELNGEACSTYDIGLHIITPDNTDIKVRKVYNLNTLRDYRENSFDMITAVVEVTVEEYAGKIYPARGALNGSIYRTKGSSSGVTSDNIAELMEYKVFLLTNIDQQIFDQSYMGKDSMAKESNTIIINIQLMEKSIYYAKHAEFNSILGPGVIEDYLYYFMSYKGHLKTWIHPPDNTASVENTIIPPGIDFMNLANWLQKEGPGVYNHGINTYFQEGIMYVYPVALFTPHEDRMRLKIFRAGTDVGVGTDNTYAIIDGILNLISSGMVNMPAEDIFLDDREMIEQSIGNTFRWNSPLYQSDVIDRSEFKHRYTSKGSYIHSLTDVDIKISKTPVHHTANPYHMRSTLNKTVGRVFMIPWQSGDINELTPGMEVHYYYMNGNQHEELFGFLEGAIENLNQTEDRFMGDSMGAEVVLKIRVP